VNGENYYSEPPRLAGFPLHGPALPVPEHWWRAELHNTKSDPDLLRIFKETL